MRSPRHLALLAAIVLAACVVADDEPAFDAAGGTLTMSAADAALVLDLVNYPGTDLEVLDKVVGLDVRAARNVVAHRDGADGVAPSADDDLFDDLAELAAIKYVGDAALSKLRAHALAHPAPAGELVEGVALRGWEAEAIVWGVSRASVEELDHEVGLDARAARNLAGAAPFASVAEIGAVPYVGAAAVGKLRAHAPTWWARMRSGGAGGLAGTFDGVTFDEATARVALEIANLASRDQLVANGVYAAGAARIVDHRPYATLAQVAAVDGVGTATMQGLRGYAQSGAWAPPADEPASCDYLLDADALAAIVFRHQEGLWEDEGFFRELLDLCGWDEAIFYPAIEALEAEIARAAQALLGTCHADEGDASEAVAGAHDVKGHVRAHGWDYLASLGVPHP